MSSTQSSYSQYAQDHIVINLLQHKRGGVFVDVGAHDGITFSNTYLLEKEYGFSGLCIEPLPQAAKACQSQRNVPVVQVATSDKEGCRTFRMIEGYSEMLSGLSHHQDRLHRARIQKEICIHGGHVKEIDVNCRCLGNILAEHKIEKVDYISIDVEGAEFATLKGFFERPVPVAVFSIENNNNDNCVCSLLEKHGYIRAVQVSCDDFYVPGARAGDAIIADLNDRYGRTRKKKRRRFWRL